MKVKRIDKSIQLPKYATNGSVGLDLFVRKNIVIKPKTMDLIPLNVIIKAPENTFIGILPRSSTFKKTGLILANSLGVIDRDYCGPDDEICAIVFNTRNYPVIINKGNRFFQLIVFNCETPEIEEIDIIENKTRGGFGSTGN